MPVRTVDSLEAQDLYVEVYKPENVRIPPVSYYLGRALRKKGASYVS